jgi:hypothetical protein
MKGTLKKIKLNQTTICHQTKTKRRGSTKRPTRVLIFLFCFFDSENLNANAPEGM